MREGQLGGCTEALGVMKASGVISLGIAPLAPPPGDRKSTGAGSEEIFGRSPWEPPESLSELMASTLSLVRGWENPGGHTGG